MGMSFFSSCSCSCSQVSEPDPINRNIPNPDPNNFEILELVEIDSFLIVKVRYPDCTNHEGMKILVYRNVDEKWLREQTFLDPHFCDNHTSPIARFEPTVSGWECALIFVMSAQRTI